MILEKTDTIPWVGTAVIAVISLPRQAHIKYGEVSNDSPRQKHQFEFKAHSKKDRAGNESQETAVGIILEQKRQQTKTEQTTLRVPTNRSQR